jgi:hypothetical protein
MDRTGTNGQRDIWEVLCSPRGARLVLLKDLEPGDLDD